MVESIKLVHSKVGKWVYIVVVSKIMRSFLEYSFQVISKLYWGTTFAGMITPVLFLGSTKIIIQKSRGSLPHCQSLPFRPLDKLLL